MSSWTDVVQAVAAISVPIVVGGIAYLIDDRQKRSSELLSARLEYYKQLAPRLNLLMVYMTFIGRWRDLSPLSIVGLKRTLDEEFYVAAPLFSEGVLKAYEILMSATFSTFNEWGSDARIKTSAFRRRQAWQGTWDSSWDSFFTIGDSEAITGAALRAYREQYDALIGAMVRDIDITRTRASYTTSEVSLNAHAPTRTDIRGAAG